VPELQWAIGSATIGDRALGLNLNLSGGPMYMAINGADVIGRYYRSLADTLGRYTTFPSTVSPFQGLLNIALRFS
jgi:hypothetical protein